MSGRPQVSYDEFKLIKQRNSDQDKQISSLEQEIDDLKRELDEKDDIIAHQEERIAQLIKTQGTGKIPRPEGPLHWSDEMVRRFRVVCSEHQGLMTQDFWDRTAEYVGGGCTDFDCREMWKRFKDQNGANDRRPWTHQEEEDLKRAVDTWIREKNVIIHRGQPIIHWRFVGMTLNRPPHSCENKWVSMMQQSGQFPPQGAAGAPGGGPITTGGPPADRGERGGYQPRGPPAYVTGAPRNGGGHGGAPPVSYGGGPPPHAVSSYPPPRGYQGHNPRGGPRGYSAIQNYANVGGHAPRGYAPGGYAPPVAEGAGYYPPAGAGYQGVPRSEKRNYDAHSSSSTSRAPPRRAPRDSDNYHHNNNHNNNNGGGGDDNQQQQYSDDEGTSPRGGGGGRGRNNRSVSRSPSPSASRDGDNDNKRKRY